MKRILFLLIPLLVVASCAGGTKRDAEHNEADIEFAQQMIPHHQQAIEMADLVLGRGYSPEVLALSKQIKAAQDPEIATMKGWLEDWDEEPAAGGHRDMGDMEMGALKAAKGEAFDALWISMMIEHHEGAIAMARDESTNGQSLKVKDMARAIIAAQEKEIATMKGLLP